MTWGRAPFLKKEIGCRPMITGIAIPCIASRRSGRTATRVRWRHGAPQSGRDPSSACLSWCLRALSHPAGELVHVEIVAPGFDLAVPDLEGPHNLQLERLIRELEHVHPLGHHDRTICCNVDNAEVDALDRHNPRRSGSARTDERADILPDGLSADHRRKRDIVVDRVVGEKCGQVGGRHVVAPRRAEPAHYFDWALQLPPPVVDLDGTLFQTSGLDDQVLKATAMPDPSVGAAGTWRFGLRQSIGICQVIGVPYI